jgi:hypothetical protein
LTFSFRSFPWDLVPTLVPLALGKMETPAARGNASSSRLISYPPLVPAARGMILSNLHSTTTTSINNISDHEIEGRCVVEVVG